MKYKWNLRNSFNASYVFYKFQKVKRKQVADKADAALKHRILRYYHSIPPSEIDEEIKKALKYLRHNRFHVYPSPFVKKYNPEKIEAFVDEASGFPYVWHQGHRLYFKKNTPLRHVQKKYAFLLLEQDESSPHRYLSTSFNVNSNDVVVDLGVAEGNFSLEIVDKVKYLYLFEPDKEWIDALNLTFSPWKNKVCIINKSVSNIDEGDFVSIDGFFSDKALKPTFFKVDIEGFENKFLEGGEKSILENNCKVVICTYHKEGDFENISSWFVERGYKIEPSKGYMLFPGEHQSFEPPFFRKGLIRTYKI
ncbi:MAG: FkbM family methyltransferase [Microbacter sp.]